MTFDKIGLKLIHYILTSNLFLVMYAVMHAISCNLFHFQHFSYVLMIYYVKFLFLSFEIILQSPVSNSQRIYFLHSFIASYVVS